MNFLSRSRPAVPSQAYQPWEAASSLSLPVSPSTSENSALPTITWPQEVRASAPSLLQMRGVHLLCIAALAALLASLIHVLPLRSNMVVDNFGLDTFFHVRGAVPATKVASELVQSRDIITIELPPNPPRPLLAKILSKLGGAKAIAIDLMLFDREGMLRQQKLSRTEQQRWYGSDIKQWRRDTQILAAQIRKMPQVIVGAWPEQERLISPKTPWQSHLRVVWHHPAPLIWNAARHHAHLTVIGDDTLGTIRSVRLWENAGVGTKNRQPALGLALAALARGTTPQKLAPVTTAASDDSTLINYLGGREAFDNDTNRLSYKCVLDDWLTPEDLKGKIILLGENSLASKEIKDTPFGAMPGVNVHAMVTATLLAPQGAPRFLSLPLCALLAFACCSALMLPLNKCAAWSSWLLAAAQAAGLLAFGGWLLGSHNTVLPLSLPLMALSLAAVGMTYYEYLHARGKLGLVVGTEAKSMLQGFGRGPRLGGRIEVASAFFCDLRNYSDLAATLPLPLLAQLINDYTSTLVNVVRRHGGRPIDFQGDGMFVLFQAKKRESEKEFAMRAVKAALEAQSAFETLHPHWKQLGVLSFDAAIAIATGSMMIGMVGGEKHLKPGAVGNVVNVASRLQTLSNECGFNILLTQETWEAVHEQAAQASFDITYCGQHTIKGQEDLLEVWGVGKAKLTCGVPLQPVTSEHSTS